MKGKIEGSEVMAVGFLGILPQVGLAPKVDDFGAVLGFILWILIGILIVKVLVLFAGVS